MKKYGCLTMILGFVLLVLSVLFYFFCPVAESQPMAGVATAIFGAAMLIAGSILEACGSVEVPEQLKPGS
jgi:uncharacterized membrane protein